VAKKSRALQAQRGLPHKHLRVKLFQFMQELQRNRPHNGRLDARFAGPTYNLIGEAADYDRKKLHQRRIRWHFNHIYAKS